MSEEYFILDEEELFSSLEKKQKEYEEKLKEIYKKKD